MSVPGTPAEMAKMIAELLIDAADGLDMVGVMKEEANVIGVVTEEGLEFFVEVTDA